jgi:hypothetical protein
LSFKETTDRCGEFDLFGAQVGIGAESCQAVIDAEQHPLYKKRMIELISDEVVASALRADATARKVMQKELHPEEGQIVGCRLNLNIQKSQGVAVMTVHQGNSSDGYKRNKGLYNGAALCYLKVVTLRDVYFNVQQSGREKIASGSVSKFPMASADGAFVDCSANFDGIEISFNPKNVRLFCDADMRPIRFAEHVTCYANRLYARGRIEYYTESTAPLRAGSGPCAIRFPS